MKELLAPIGVAPFAATLSGTAAEIQSTETLAVAGDLKQGSLKASAPWHIIHLTADDRTGAP